ncbi:hypothetical protein [Aquifex sp.]
MIKDPYEVLLVLAAGFFYILFAGAYAGFYTVYKMRGNEKFKHMSLGFAGAMIYCAYILTTNGIFDPFWKGLIAFATFAYIFIPFIMWKVVIKIHEHEQKLKREENGLS